MNEQEADFKGKQTLNHFFRTVMQKMAENKSDIVEMEMDIDDHAVEFSIHVTAIRRAEAA